MNPRLLIFEVQIANAIDLPKALVKAMNDREGNGEAGLLLTQRALDTLDEYRVNVRRLPGDLAQARQWLGYVQISEPELNTQNMLTLFRQLRAHGDKWPGLREQSRKVTFGLQQQAGRIESEGAKVVELVARTRALGANQGSWASLQEAPPVALDEYDRKLVADMGGQLQRLHGVIDDYGRLVDALRVGLESFRDAARLKLVPAIVEKSRAARRFADSPLAHDLRWELGTLNEDIEAARREYKRYSRQSSAGAFAGPFGFLVSRSIYGRKARSARAELRGLEQRRQQFSQRLAQHVRMEGRVNELNSEMQRLDNELWEVVLSTGHLHTAWQVVEAYLESSMGRLQRMNTRQQLAIFIFHFRQFLSQWVAIGEHARSMVKVFG